MSPDPSSSPRRGWPRISLRGLMILIVVVAVPTGWAARTIRAQRAAVAAVRAGGGSVAFDWQFERVGTAPNGRPIYRKEPAAPAWLRRWLGDELFEAVQTVRFPGRATPEAPAALVQCDRLERFDLGDSTGAGDGLRPLRGLRRLESVSISGFAITDPLLADLAAIRSLRELNIGQVVVRPAPGSKPGSPAADEGFARLAALPRLEKLIIKGFPRLTDAGMARLLAGLPGLTMLYLDGGPPTLTATTQAVARHHPDLESLAVRQTGVADADLPAIAGLGRLRSIDLGKTAVTDAGIAHLRPLRGLMSVVLDDTGVGDASLEVVAEWPEVWQLLATKTKITDAGLAHLARLPKLRTLFVGGSSLSDAGMPALGRVAGLERLILDQASGLTDEGLASLRALAHLRELTLIGAMVTPEGVAALRAAVPTLKPAILRPARPAPPSPTGAHP